jgi:hypothetical protein
LGDPGSGTSANDSTREVTVTLALYFDRNRALADLGLIAEADSTPHR